MLRMCKMRMCGMVSLAVLLIGSLTAGAADKLTAPQLVEMAKAHSPELRAAIEATLDAKQLKAGTAWAGHGSQFFFAVESEDAPMLVIDDFAPKSLEAIAGSHLWYGTADVEPLGRPHQFHYLVKGESFGAALICRRLGCCRISKRACRRELCRKSSFTPARSTTG